MTQALPAETVLVQLAAVERRETISILADLGPAERAVARTLLADIPADSRIAVAGFVSDVRRRATEQAITEAQRRPSGAAWRYAIELMDEGQREEFRRLVAEGSEPNRAAESAMPRFASPLRANGDAEPDDDSCTDDLYTDNQCTDETKPKRRRSIPRRPLRRDQAAQRADGGVSSPALAGPQASAKERPGGLPARPSRPLSFLGPKLFSSHADGRPNGQSIDYDANCKHFDPPWLLDDGGEDEDDEKETDDVDVEARASA
jgi:hypothetical protein